MNYDKINKLIIIILSKTIMNPPVCVLNLEQR
jgi:hypothetical protein